MGPGQSSVLQDSAAEGQDFVAILENVLPDEDYLCLSPLPPPSFQMSLKPKQNKSKKGKKKQNLYWTVNCNMLGYVTI